MQLQNKHVLLATQTANWQLLLAVAIPGEDVLVYKYGPPHCRTALCWALTGLNEQIHRRKGS